ncbi:MAG: WD40 repeat domain-containing protein [Candidatus Symbiothrix sp.]|jgi:hypothetical protein|nr:WD40 repeat domain-containing protein [Candidatus Symbiothrix sp.]
MNKNWLFLAGMLVLTSATMAWGQVKEYRQHASKYNILEIDNSGFRLVYKAVNANNSAAALYTYKDNLVTTAPVGGRFALNPNGSTIAFVDNRNINIYSFIKKDEYLFSIKGSKMQIPQALAYSADARQFIAAYSNGKIIFYNTQKYLPSDTIESQTSIKALAISPNNYFVVSLAGDTADVWNLETKAHRARLALNAKAYDAAFSPDASMLAITTQDKILIFNTRNWELIQRIDTKTQSRYPSFNADNKYLVYALKADSSSIVVYNVLKQTDEQLIPESGSVQGLNFINTNKKSLLLSARRKSIVFWNTDELTPYYGKRLNQDVDNLMNDWIKMMDGESLEDYQIRVNDSTRYEQMGLFQQQVATEMVGDRLAIEDPFAGDYENEEGLLTINFNTLPPIALSVPETEVGDFKDAEKLKFDNEVYNLRSDDDFELVYVEVTNEVTDKVYIYDKIGRVKLTDMETDPDFVPLDIIQQAQQEEIKLQAVKEEIIATDKQDKLITENTQINVDAKVIPDVDTDGNKILNYQVNYQYEVINKEFSLKEDFPPGIYDVNKSNAALSLMKIIKQSFEEGDFAKYLTEDKRVKIVITGTADGAPINGKIKYDGRYGNFTDESYFSADELKAMTVTSETGITSNPQLAFIRAAGVKNYLENNIKTLKNTRNDYFYNVQVSEERGGDYRKIHIQFLILDAFKQQ